MARIEGRAGEGQRDESGQRGHLDQHQHRVDLGALARTDNQQSGDQQRDDQRGQVDEPSRSAAENQWSRNGCGGDRVLHDQRPAHGPGEKLAHAGVAVGVGGARDGYHRGDFCVAERRDDADRTGNGEGEHQAGSGLLSARCGEHEYPCADHAADAEQHQLEPTESTMERLLFRRRQNGVERLHAAEDHGR